MIYLRVIYCFDSELTITSNLLFEKYILDKFCD